MANDLPNHAARRALSLPEILEAIALFMDGKDVLALSATCRQIKELMVTSSALRTMLYFAKSRDESDPSAAVCRTNTAHNSGKLVRPDYTVPPELSNTTLYTSDHLCYQYNDMILRKRINCSPRDLISDA
ncbi:hypothetical protein LTR08_003675 [Meristemomyces frigidus]|nr:hypothetical protein LTR08_003675 [Meristemomyces frigidus]